MGGDEEERREKRVWGRVEGLIITSKKRASNRSIRLKLELELRLELELELRLRLWLELELELGLELGCGERRGESGNEIK